MWPTWAGFIPHHATFYPAAATANNKIGSNLRSLKERFVTQHLQSRTVDLNCNILCFASFKRLLKMDYFNRAYTVDNARSFTSFYQHLLFFIIVNDFNARRPSTSFADQLNSILSLLYLKGDYFTAQLSHRLVHEWMALSEKPTHFVLVYLILFNNSSNM